MPRLLLSSLLLLAIIFPASAAPPDAGSAPVLDPRWTVSTLREDRTRRWVLIDAVKAYEDQGRPILHAGEPLAIGERIVFRSQRGVHAVDRRTGKTVWEAESAWSLDGMNSESPKAPILARWITAYLGSGRAAFLLENAVLGRLATDGQFVFAVDDLAVPPFAGAFLYSDAPYQPHFGYSVNDAAYHNRLQAYSLRTGKLTWEVGNRNGGDALSDAFFLGAPLVKGGQLLAAVEKEGHLRLVCLDSSNGNLLWQLDLAAVRVRGHLDSERRLEGVRLALAGNTVVCLLGDAVVGVDLETRSVNWAYTTPREPAPVPVPGRAPALYLPGRSVPALAASHPAIDLRGGRVVFNAPGGDGLVCLRLKDGRVLWRTSASRDDVYLAGIVEGRVLIVGRRGVRALTLTDGKRQWFAETGEPSGRGVVAGGVYHLPLRKDVRMGRAGVLSLDASTGEIVAWAQASGAKPPGNLVLDGREVLSQALDRVTLFPQLHEAILQADERVAKAPEDSATRFARGELRLAAGDAAGAVQDFRAALANEPKEDLQARAQRGLYLALTQLLDRDFAAGEKHLVEYEKLCQLGSAADQQLRMAELHYLVGRGRQQQGRLREAVRAYSLHLVTAPDGEPLSVPQEGALRMQRFVRVAGVLRELLESAPQSERAALQEELAKAWRTATETRDLHALRRDARRLTAALPPNLESRLVLVELLTQEKDFLTAELLLSSRPRFRTDPTSAGRVVEAHAHLSLARGLPEETIYFLRLLERDFGKVVIRDGKTGAALAMEMRKDERLLAPQQEPGQPGTTRFTIRRLPAGEVPAPRWMLFDPEGEILPWFHTHALALNLNPGDLKVLDVGGKEEWSQRLSTNHFQSLAPAQLTDRLGARLCRVRGHLVILTLGTRVYAVDPLARKVLWERSLLGSEGASQGFPTGAVVTVDAREGLPQLQFPDGFVQKLGQVAAVTPEVVCVQALDGLFGLDALTGAVLWQRSDVEPGSSFFHDDDHLFLVRTDASARAETRAFAVRDGSHVQVPNRSTQFAGRLGEEGTRLLLAESEPRLKLRLYDALTGKEVWQREFSRGTRSISCLDSAFVAVVDPQGRVTVLDRSTGVELATLAVQPVHLEGVRKLRLLADPERFYLFPETPVASDRIVGGVVMPNVQAGSGLRTIPVHGQVYAFRRDNGRLVWRTEVTSQQLLLWQFADLPVLILTSRFQTLSGGAENRLITPTAPLLVIDRRLGKYLFDGDTGWMNPPFHHAMRDPQSGTIELSGTSGRFRISPR